MSRPVSPIPVLVAAGVIAIVALLVYGVSTSDPDTGIEAALASGERPPAPAVTLPRLDGEGEASLADYHGRVVVLNYWASWCKPCREESPLLQRFQQKIEPRGGVVLGVDVLDVTSDAEDFIREFGLTYPMLRDDDGATQSDFGVVAYPETIVIDRQGRIAAIKRGPVDERFLADEVLPLLEEPA